MAESPAWRPHVTGWGAVGVAIGLALVNPAGPWQPFAVISGWAVVVVMVVGVVAGFPKLVAVGSVVQVGRVAIAGLAGDLVVPAAVWAAALVVMVELADASFAMRDQPLDLATALVRTVGAGAVAWLTVGMLTGMATNPLTGGGWPLVGLVAAFGVGGIVSHLARRPS